MLINFFDIYTCDSGFIHFLEYFVWLIEQQRDAVLNIHICTNAIVTNAP